MTELTKKGKKFRLPSSPEQAVKELELGLEAYVAWALGKSEDPERERQLTEWATAVKTKAVQNWKLAEQRRGPTDMDGYPGLRQQIQEARGHLVFLHDDRAPHGLFMVCKRWYQRQMALYLADTGVFAEEQQSWDAVVDAMKAKLKDWGFRAGEGITYNYGIWKPKKSKFRFIAGTRSAGGGAARPQGPPRSPSFFLSKSLVKLLKVVITSLKELDIKRQQEGGPRCFWSIDSINEFSRLARTHADLLVKEGMATFDFTTMYTAFPQETLLSNVMASIEEAHQFESSKSPPGGGEVMLSEEGWSFCDGFPLSKIKEFLTFSIATAYTLNGGKLRKQIRGIPMGLPHAPQLVALACYPVEKAYALVSRPAGVICRYIDDFFCSGMQPPPQESYQMEFQKTSDNPARVVYLGVLAEVREGALHTTIYDREDEYPFHIVRYPDYDTVAPHQQFGGVLMGRLVACQEACSHMQDFKESVANVVRRALCAGTRLS